MRDFRRGRGFARATVLAAAASLTAGALVVPASAQPATVAKCAHLNAPAPKHDVSKRAVLSGCSVPKATGGGGKVSALLTTPGSGHATITWNKAGSTTSFDYKIFPDSSPDEKETQGCPAHTKEFVLVGQVTGGSGAPATLIPNGRPVSGEICVSATRVVNEPGSKVQI